MNYFFHKDAEAELKEAADYYEKQQPRLGLQFVAEIYLMIQRVVAHPEAWPRMDADGCGWMRMFVVHWCIGFLMVCFTQ